MKNIHRQRDEEAETLEGGFEETPSHELRNETISKWDHLFKRVVPLCMIILLLLTVWKLRENPPPP